MKSLEELNTIKEQALKDMILRKGKHLTKVVVSMDDCGIKAGAKEVMDLFVRELRQREIMDAVVMMTHCQGICDKAPVVKIINKDGNITTYGNVTQDKVNKIIEEHILKGNIVEDFVI